ncbi:serine hydrolase domain-containing protein [Mucilaginibacter sp.]|uniref:serine hydrolase domain-containing protein n=1 Tax=Mucilaginibacter sp. TaxID=1882438 RepID=UPI00283DA48C|nr:serine hydrolase domain-containing protein [Mucilaginibacter sp.]MDR3696679.1 serine hydrolase [Mucilaginibacter sp.]
MKRLLLIFLFILLFQAGKAQSWKDTATIITHLFDRYKPDNPGCQLSISRNGKIVFSKAWGLADLENHVPYTTETLTEAGSITKQFTAAAILLLEQQGKLSLNDDVRKYIPELPTYGHVIRLRNLLHHTSGIREWSNLEAITGWPRTTKAYTNADVLHLLCSQQQLNNVPGAEFIYSNSNYLLLALIVERVSGMKLPEFTDRYIFKPAGMTHTCWRDDFKKIVHNRGIAYIKKNGIYEINLPNENVYGPGALLTTTDDLLRWTNFFLDNKLGSPGLLAKQLAIEPIPGGADAYYAAGLFIGKFKGYDIISHTGQTAGYVGVVESLPELKLSVAWLSNTTEFKDSLFVGITAIDNLFIKNTLPEIQAKAPAGVALPPAKTKKYTGWYRNSQTNHGINITMKHDSLWLNGSPLIPVSQTDFRYLESKVAFNTTGGFIYTTAEKVTIPFTKERPAEITANYLKTFTGTFYSKETESSFRIILKKDKLMLEQNYLKDVELQPAYKDAFDFTLNLDSDMSPVQANILFKRTSKNGHLFCEVSMNDARKINFRKVY